MKKLLMVSLICLMVFQSATLLGMESELNNGNDKVLEGVLGISWLAKPSYPTSRTGKFICRDLQRSFLKRVLGVTVKSNELLIPVLAKSNELLIPVLAKSNESYYWSCYSHEKFIELHPEYSSNLIETDIKLLTTIAEEMCFPSYLPWSLLQGKKEGDVVRLLVYGLNVELICSQLLSRQGDKGPERFEDKLKKVMDIFAKNPKCVFGDEKTLVKKGILVKTGTDKLGMSIHKHGTNGFYFHNANPKKQNGCTVQ